MGYYENPPMVNPSSGINAITAGIVSASESIAKGLMMRGQRIEETEKETRLTIKKLQDDKNKIDLLYNQKLSDWSKDHSKVGYGVDEQITSILTKKIRNAADAHIALTQETDPAKRSEYLKLIRDADGFMNNASVAGKAIAMDSATWRENASSISVGVPGGWAINGSPDQIKSRRAALEITGGLDGLYENTSMKVEEDSTGTGFNIVIGGRIKGDSKDFDPITINSSAYVKADAEGAGGFLSKVENLDEFNKTAQKNILDKEGNILPGYLSEKHETVDLPSSGTSGGVGRDIWQIKDGQRVNVESLKKQINNTSEVKASAYLKADKEQSLRTLLDYTLQMQPGYYDEQFKTIGSPELQKAKLAELLTNSAFKTVSKNWKTTTENGQTVYWEPNSKIALKDKPSAASLRAANRDEGDGDGGGKTPGTTYKSEYYKNLIKGYKIPDNATTGQIETGEAKFIAENLNKLSGAENKYVSRYELYDRWKKQGYKSGDFETGNTIEQEYKDGEMKGKDIVKAFNQLYPPGNLFVEKGTNNYVPVKKYNLKKAEDRIKLALDQTSEAGERKILQKSLLEARLKDWIEANPIKTNESQEQYAQRARRNIKK